MPWRPSPHPPILQRPTVPGTDRNPLRLSTCPVTITTTGTLAATPTTPRAPASPPLTLPPRRAESRWAATVRSAMRTSGAVRGSARSAVMWSTTRQRRSWRPSPGPGSGRATGPQRRGSGPKWPGCPSLTQVRHSNPALSVNNLIGFYEENKFKCQYTLFPSCICNKSCLYCISCVNVAVCITGSSDDEISHITTGSRRPVQFRTTPPLEVHKPLRTVSPPSKMLGVGSPHSTSRAPVEAPRETNNNRGQEDKMLLRAEGQNAGSVRSASPRKKYRPGSRHHNRPSLDFEKMQQVRKKYLNRLCSHVKCSIATSIVCFNLCPAGGYCDHQHLCPSVCMSIFHSTPTAANFHHNVCLWQE